MMRLLLDLGNTKLKWAFEKSSKLGDHGGIAHNLLTLEKLDSELLAIGRPNSVWLSSVAPKAVEEIVDKWVKDRFDIALNRVAVTQYACGVENRYADSSQLGVDRWLAAIGSRKFCSKNHVIVIDAGTAITIDVLTADNAYIGGAILPGAFLMHDSLISRTAGIASRFTGSVRLIGNTTQECVNSGIHHGLVGAVDRIVSHMCLELANGQENVLIDKLVTGGDADLILSNSNFEYRCVEDLVLHGLASVAQGDL